MPARPNYQRELVSYKQVKAEETVIKLIRDIVSGVYYLSIQNKQNFTKGYITYIENIIGGS